MALRRVTASTDAGRAAREALRNLTRDPMVSILIDAYDDDWAKMWWVRLRGNGRVVSGGSERNHAWQLLRQKYPQFAGTPSGEGAGPMIAVDIEHWAGWAYT
jgi:PPOX class probable F420-dependent enzyme